MHSVQTGLWNPRPPSKHVFPIPAPPPSNSRPAHVTSTIPAKRITFYKSGDSQFGGVRMAIHKRSFKCFDALLDDLSQKVPLPFGVRTVTTPRGTHTIKHLEQLQDGGCYLCSDRRQAKPVNMELVNKQSGIWYHNNRRPQRPETSSTTPPGHLHMAYRQRRILLVKNSEPGMRRSVVLSRRTTRSLRAFLDEVSEVMQFHVRKVYTVEGRRIDNVQSLMTCPGVLVCVGREAFSPMLINFIRKSSEEKLPGLGNRSPGLGPRTPGNGARSPATQGVRSPPHGAQSRASEYSEGHESKKNINFGLETKKSIIHPRSDSSNRSARFSFSSEKSYGNGVTACPQAKPAIMNDDIEKRVLVNKDGSLSVEMRVRFRLQNDETLQWSTQIKKSPSLTNECCPLSQAQPHYLQQGQSESCSDPDSTSFDQEGVDYSSQPLQCELEGNRCPCCHQRHEQQYDLWENPAHSHKSPPVPPPHASSHTHTVMRHTHSSSSSSSCNSRRVVRCRARLSSCGGGSGSEQSQLVQEEMCLTEQVEHRLEVEQDGDTHVEVHKVSRCCSRSEVVVMDSNLQPLSRKSAEEEEDRPLSAVSSSSHVLQSLKEDQDDEDDDLPPSVSRCCHSNEPSPTPETQLHEKPTSDISAISFHSTKHKEREERGSRAVSAASFCLRGEATTYSTAGPNEVDQVPCNTSKISETRMPESEEGGPGDDDKEIKRAVSGLSGHTGLSASSQKSGTSSVCPNCGGCKRKVNSVSSGRASQRSNHSNQASPNRASPLPNSDDAASDVSTQSNKTNLTNNGRLSAISNILEGKVSSAMSRTSSPEATGKERERAPSATSATSHKSNRSHNSGYKGSTVVTAEKEEERGPSVVSNHSAKSSKSKHTTEAPDISLKEKAEGENTAERAVSSLSAKSCVSAETDPSVRSCDSNCQSGTKDTSQSDNPAVEEHNTNKRAPSSCSVKSNASAKSGKTERPDSARSTKSNISVKSSTSHRSTCGNCAKAAADEATIKVTGKEIETEVEERATSAMSAKSNLSAKSNKSHKSTKASEGSEAGGDGEERAPSQMSGTSVKSDKSVKSTKSSKSNCNDNEMVTSSSSKTADEAEENKKKLEVETQQRPDSIMLAKLENNERAPSVGSSKSHKSNYNQNTDSSSEIVHNTGNQENAEVRAASTLSHKSASSAKSHNKKIEGEDMVDRPPSAKSSKSMKSNLSTASPVPSEAKESQERVASVMSAKSKSSVRSNTSHKSNSSANVVTIKTPVGDNKEENVTKERAPSAASGKSNVSSAVSQKSNRNGKADIAIIETADGDKKVANESAPKIKSNVQTLSPKRTRSPQMHSPNASAASTKSSKSPVQQLLNGSGAGETRGPSALSVYSTISAKSGKSKCRCGAASEFDKATTEKEDEDMEVNLEVKSEKASERAASALSLGGMDQPLSQNSTESVSLGLPEETSDSDSGKSGFCVHRSAEAKAKGQAKTSTPDLLKDPEVSTMKEDVEITGSTVSQKSSNTARKNGSAVDIPTIETPSGEENGVQKTEKAASTISVKSSRSNKSSCNCKSKEKHANASPTKAGNGNETEIVKSDPMTNGNNDRNSSAMSSTSAKVRSKSSASAVAKTAGGQSANNDNENQENSRAASEAKGKEDNAYNEAISSQSPCCLRPESAALASEQSKEKDPVECHKSKFSTGSDSSSFKMASSLKNETPIKSSSPCPLHSKVETCSESTLSHSLSAADLLKETMAAARPCSRQSKASKSSDKSRSKKSGTCQRSSNQKDKGEELTPACLPNTSPSEVVSDWLRSIPVNSNMLALGDDFNEEELRAKEMEEIPGGETAKESHEGEKIDKEEKVEPEEDKEKEDEAKCDIAQEEKGSDPASGEAEGTSGRPSDLQLGSEALPRNWQSSAAVMKVLLSSSLGRCRSMPEVSPVYGRRLSTSARGLLDCLAQLQLIEPALSPGCDLQKGRSQQYDDIMAILHSLWLTEPGNIEAKEAKENKNSSPEQVTPPRSSSGVDMSSGSGGSGKENGNQGGDETPPKERESLHAHEVAEKVVEEEEEEGNVTAADTEIETEHKETFTEQAKEDAAEEPVQSEEAPQREESPKPSESSDKTSAKDSSKSPTDNERETLEESSTGTPPTVLRAPLAKRPSQDPDPVWVLHLLKKLEKQFMDHYINAMAEFKVRWDLDDSLILDTMICDLREEVSRRIQSSIEREMRKIQSRAGRGGRSPRPPQGTNLSRESTTTEKRRLMLKVMKNQSVKTGDSLSDGEMTGEFSDQRSEDEYCPCEACVRKKMAARPLKTNPLAAEAPVMKDFDLLKILQLKKSPAPAPATASQPVVVEGERLLVDDDGRNLDVLQEEEEEDETKEDIRAAVVLEDTIAEEDEEVEQEKGEGKAREEEAIGAEQQEKEKSSAGEEEQDEERTSDEEAREDETSETGEEEEDCQCKCARNEEESDQEEEGQTGEDEGETEDETEENGGEMGTGEEEEETSDQDTIKEVIVGEGEITENGESDERVDEKEKTTGSQSEEQEDDSAAEITENEQSTFVEVVTERNISASAENEDDGEDSTGEGESSEDKKEGESEEQEGGACEEERTSPQGQGAVTAAYMTEGEEADAEDSDVDGKRPSGTGHDKSGCEEKEESGGDGDEEEDAVKEFKPEEENEEKANGNKREDGALLHQFTRTSVESQPGSLEDIDTESPQNPVDSIEVPKMADSISTGGGKGQRRSRSPARVKRRKPKEGEDELDSF